MTTLPSAEEVLTRLRGQADPANVEGMARYGINPAGTLGVPMPVIRTAAKELKKAAGRRDEGPVERHDLAAALWASGVHEARILAALVDVPAFVTRKQAEDWAAAFDSWDVCDQVCSNLFDRTAFAWDLAREWPSREEEFVRRAGFVMVAALAVHDKTASDEAFLGMLPIVERHAEDGRNLVKKGASWALRQIGKRDLRLNEAAVQVARRLAARDDPASRWVGRDAERELTSEKTLERLRR